MREITRIHIAKVAYDIELDAKKEIESYITALERYADDPEILDDIEIRITELLEERGVKGGGVVTSADVAAVRAQLGEPSDFASEELGDTGSLAIMSEEGKRVYRDTDNGVMGGVLAGLGQYFGVDPLWVRLVFVVLLFVSFGTGIIVYFILWIIIPPARTATERLRMSGQPVTLAAIKEKVGTDEQRSERAKVARRVLGFGSGVFLLLMALGSLAVVVAAALSMLLGYGRSAWIFSTPGPYTTWWFLAMMGLFILSGLLFSALCAVLASAVFRRQWTRRIGIAVVAIITAGLVVFASGVGAGVYGYITEQARFAELPMTSSTDLPANFKSIKKLTIISDESMDRFGLIEYVVSDKMRFELDSMPGVRPQFEIADDSLSATVRLVQDEDKTVEGWGYVSSPVLRIYGPELDHIDADSVNISYTAERPQSKLAIALRATELELYGAYSQVEIVSQDGAVANVSHATIGTLIVNNQDGLVQAGVVRTLTVTQPDICPATSILDEPNSLVRVQGISGDRLIYNGIEQPAENVSNACEAVRIGEEE